MKLKTTELKLADVVRVWDDPPWNSAIVKKITETEVHFFRPYGATGDFSYTAGVICYIGVEEWSVPLSQHLTYEVLERKELK